MPIYEYEPTDHDCLICGGRFEALQEISAEALTLCPTCGLGCKRVVSRATFKSSVAADPDRAAKKGFATFKRAEKGVWEKVGGEGPDYMVGTKEDMAVIESEKTAPKKVIDLDKD
jgi:putative FmdB family regulatory protein